MKTLIFLAVLAYVQLNDAFMNIKEFKTSNLLRCYDTNMQDRRTYQKNINGQTLPLPSSMETFVSLVERYESLHPNDQTQDLISKLLRSLRMDDLRPAVTEEIKYRNRESNLFNRIKRHIFSVPDQLRYEFAEEDFTEDERCALHFMLSHTVNDSRSANTGEVQDNANRVKQPREFGVVSMYSNRVHAFALGRVLLGIYAGLQPPEIDVTSILQKEKKTEDSLRNVKINPVYAVTLGDLVTRLLDDDVTKILGNGEWTDISCPTEYMLEDNNDGFVSNSELRGAVDGLIIGRRIQENRQDFSDFSLSQILRQYYGYSGLIDRTKWCERETNFQSVPDIDTELLKFYNLYKAIGDEGEAESITQQKISDIINTIRNNIFKDIDKKECSILDNSIERKYVSPRNIFAILDYSPTGISKLNFQAEVIGNLSSDFNFRPRGNLMGVYSNLKPVQQNTLDVIVKNNGIAGCPSCFAKYYSKTGSKDDDAEIIKDVNGTFAHFDLEQEELEQKYQSEFKAASPGKIVLFFNFGNPSREYRVEEALWNLKQYYRGVTILAIGDNREGLSQFVENDQTDVFTSSLKTIYDLKQRINKVPGEYTFKNCYHSSSSQEADNKQVAFIPPNKIQYWAMYPQYFLKSYRITMKFRPQEGATIRVCFSRWYGMILEGKSSDCKESTGGEIEFYTENPCHKRNVHTCDPFYFSVEGKKQPTTYCKSLRCSTPHDIQFEFEHHGISCNTASFITVSSLALLLAALMYYVQRQ